MPPAKPGPNQQFVLRRDPFLPPVKRATEQDARKARIAYEIEASMRERLGPMKRIKDDAA